MADFFLSYANEDREMAAALARALEAAGWTVWWERRIPASRTWRSVLDEALNDSRCMIVLWSGQSVTSDRVKEEAEEARRRGMTLIPVQIERVEPPIEFRLIQAADLTDWDGSSTAPSVQHLIADLESLGGRSGQRPAPARQPAEARSPARVGVVTAVAAAVAGAVIGAIDLLRPSRYRAKGSSKSTKAETPRSAPVSEPVLFGVAAPRSAAARSGFTASFAAYIAAARGAAQEHLEKFGEKDDRVVMDIPPDREPRWRIGAPVTIRLTGEHFGVTPGERSFEWNGRENLASFAVQVNADAPTGTLQLCFHVFLGPVQIAFIPLGVAIATGVDAAQSPRLDVRAPSSVFVSYSSKDAELVTRSLSTLTRWAPSLDIFQDCLDLKSNDAFKPQLQKEISARDVFLLFWSRNASASKWVLWEFQTAQVKPGMNAILPMPLEDPAIAPPPPGFEDKHLRDRFMLAGYGLRKIAETVRENS
ncbi:MAG: toll/interleukin-1 receptor domain-containing protein [Candidatus Binatia bacterium]